MSSIEQTKELVCVAYSEFATIKRWLRKLSGNKQLKIEGNCSKENSQKRTSYASKLMQVLSKKVRCVRGKSLSGPSPSYTTRTQSKVSYKNEYATLSCTNKLST